MKADKKTTGARTALMTRFMRRARLSRKASFRVAACRWRAHRILEGLFSEHADQKFGIDIVRRVVLTPLRQVPRTPARIVR